jgi:hypothetical protein
MDTTTPTWLAKVYQVDAAQEHLKRQAAGLSDERAHAIADGVAGFGRGGREYAAGLLGVTVGQIDIALKRARTASAPRGLPYDLLDRLYALELAELPPLPAHLWHGLAQILAGTFVDATWIEQPGQMLALDIEDSAGEELEEAEAKRLADAARSWTRVQALAVIDAIGRHDLDALPAKE